jgi:hypothetical protein
MKELALEIADFMIGNYEELNFTDYQAIVDFVNTCEHMHIERKDGKIVMIAIYFMVGDDALVRIASDNHYQNDPQFLVDCMNGKGENAHVYMAIHKGDLASMIRTVRSAIIYHNPKTLSWYSPDMSRFHLKNTRRNVCLPQ